MPRPSSYTEEVLNVICDRLSEGEPLAVICRDEGMPATRTVRDWMVHDQYGTHVSAAIACAREVGFDKIAYDARLTARKKGDSTDDVQRDKLIIDTDLKLLSKWDPKRYGKRTVLAGDEDSPLKVVTTIERRIVRPSD